MSIAGVITGLTADRRAGYLFDTKLAAAAVGCHERKFSDWWFRSKRKWKDLYKAQPGETCAEFAALIAEAEAERQDEIQQRPSPRAG